MKRATRTRKITCMAVTVLLLLQLCTFAASAQQTEQTAVFSVEAFSIGNGYVVEPTVVTLSQNQNAAQLLDELLADHQIAYEHAGTLEENYYLKTLHVKNSDKIPQCILDEISDCIDDGSGTKLGEYEYTAFAGWLLTVNGKPMNVGLCDYYPQENDVIRIQFSLYYGADVGLAEAMEMDKWMNIFDFYPVAQKEDITTVLAQVNLDKSVLEGALQSLYDTAVNTAVTVNAQQKDINKALFALVREQNPTVKTGDVNVNGTPEVADVLLLQKYIARASTLEVLQQAVSDTDNNGALNLEDVVTIQRQLAKMA